jgi:3-oxoacyl-[acyl-carrier-protein] synthase II
MSPPHFEQMRKRVAVTGLGLVTPLGLDVSSTWRAVLAGESGIARIGSFETEGLPVTIAGEVKGFDPVSVASAKEARKLDRNVLFALSVAHQALADFDLERVDPTRIGIVFGSAVGGIGEVARQADILRERGPDRVSPSFLANILVDAASGQLAIAFGIKGVNYAVVSACATGAHAIGEAAELIRRGAADAMIAGSTEACINPLVLAGFTAMRGLAADDDPGRACRPFDATRSGFVIAEGAGAVLLEDWDRAVTRGATIYGEVLGYGASNDAHHLAQPDPDGVGVASMMRAALQNAGVAPEQIGYLNAHGTGTQLGDLGETKAIKQVFGASAYHVPVSSTKSMIGHSFGAAGAIEAIFCLLAIRDGMLPPTINYRVPDPECDLDYIPNQARPASIEVALSNVMGLGGHNGCLVLGRG